MTSLSGFSTSRSQVCCTVFYERAAQHADVAVRVVVDRLRHALRHIQAPQRVVEPQRLLHEPQQVLRDQLALVEVLPRQPVLQPVVLRSIGETGETCTTKVRVGVHCTPRWRASRSLPSISAFRQ